MNHKKIRLAILKELSDGNKTVKSEDLGIDDNTFMDVLEFLKEENLINGYEYFMDESFSFDKTRLTLKGEEYLSENSILMKTYKGIKEFRSWLP